MMMMDEQKAPAGGRAWVRLIPHPVSCPACGVEIRENRLFLPTGGPVPVPIPASRGPTIHVEALDDDLQLHLVGHVPQGAHGRAQLLLGDEPVAISVEHLEGFPDLCGGSRDESGCASPFSTHRSPVGIPPPPPASMEPPQPPQEGPASPTDPKSLLQFQSPTLPLLPPPAEPRHSAPKPHSLGVPELGVPPGGHCSRGHPPGAAASSREHP